MDELNVTCVEWLADSLASSPGLSKAVNTGRMLCQLQERRCEGRESLGVLGFKLETSEYVRSNLPGGKFLAFFF